MKLGRGHETMKIAKHQAKKFSLYPEAVGALEEFSAGEDTERFVFGQSFGQFPEGGNRGMMEGGPWRGQSISHQSGVWSWAPAEQAGVGSGEWGT